ncbi:MAG TPA: CDP-alcohol phosphatidyltransferase family protein, partial [Dongiaceae bacterium]|nr:CDP-alcohol phosphatidyltransferase family protein [Dongiaceae bacterium]
MPTTLSRDRARSGYKNRLKDGTHAVLDPLVRGLVAIGLKPDHFTIAGLLLSVVAAFAFYDGESRVAAWFLVAGGLCDILDGQVARVGHQVTRFGAFLDSTLDRLAESVVLLGLAGFFASNLLGLYDQDRSLLRQISDAQIDPLQAMAIHDRPYSGIEPWVWL